MSVPAVTLNSQSVEDDALLPVTITLAAALKTLELIEEEKQIAWYQLKLILNAQMFFELQTPGIVFNIIIELTANLELKLRFAITGGGCHGFRYHPTLVQCIQLQDTIIPYSIKVSNRPITYKKIFCLIDPFSVQILRGGEIDYEDSVQGGHFIIRNLKTKTTCGCGSSFTL